MADAFFGIKKKVALRIFENTNVVRNIMTPRSSILLLLVPALLSACFDNTQKKKYSITTYFTSFDSSSNSMGNEGKKFKYSYEEYNSDSNLIYQELYATPDRFGNDWGKLFEKTKFYYNGKE